MSWRVLHVHNRSNWGGNLEHLRLVLAGLAGDPAFELFLGAPATETYLERFRPLPVTLLPFEARSRGDAAAVVRLAHTVRGLGIRLVHSHLRRTDWICAWARLLCPQTLWVTTVHGAVNLGPDYRRQPGLRSALYGLVLRRGFDRVLTVSHDLTRELCEREGVPPARVSTLVNGVEVVPASVPGPQEKRDARAGLGLQPDAPTLLMMGRFGRRKGHQVLLQAAAREAMAGRPWQVLLLGDGDLEAECRQLAGELGLAEQVRFLGFQAQQLPFLRAADVIVVPSYSEGLPRALLEGMVAGLAAVASDIGGVREVLEAPRHGLVFPAGDVAALAGHLERLWGSAELREALGRTARTRVVEHYGSASLVRQHADLYRELLGATPNAELDPARGLGAPATMPRRAP